MFEIHGELRPLSAPRCPLCFSAAIGEVTSCEVCSAPQHLECVRELGGCHGATPRRPRSRGRGPRLGDPTRLRALEAHLRAEAVLDALGAPLIVFSAYLTATLTAIAVGKAIGWIFLSSAALALAAVVALRWARGRRASTLDTLPSRPADTNPESRLPPKEPT
ncbi:MAG: hypothetical protein R3F62_25630 [Planctomycetota bacterium]